VVNGVTCSPRVCDAFFYRVRAVGGSWLWVVCGAASIGRKGAATGAEAFIAWINGDSLRAIEAAVEDVVAATRGSRAEAAA